MVADRPVARPREPDQRLRTFRLRLEEWADGIRAGRFEPTAKPEVVCPGCDFRRFCRYVAAGG